VNKPGFAPVIPLLSRDKGVLETVSHLRELARRLERGELQHLVVLSTARDEDPRVWMTLSPDAPVTGLIGAAELFKLDLARQALESLHDAAEDP
jgi:hypothetical protein